MDDLAKVERLRERANVSYEEAKAALEAANGDLLDAMVLLERQGKTRGPAQSTYSTEFTQQQDYIPVAKKVEEQKRSAPHPGRTIGYLIKRLWNLLLHSFLHVSRKEKDLVVLPSLTVLIIILTWRVLIPVIIVSLFFGVRYHFSGPEELEAANDILSKAGAFAEGVASEIGEH